MSRIAIGFPSWTRKFTAAVTPAAESLYPVAQVLDDSLARVVRVNGTSLTLDLTVTDGVARNIGLVGLSGTNLSSGATWRIRTYSDTAMTTLQQDSGVISAHLAGYYASSTAALAAPTVDDLDCATLHHVWQPAVVSASRAVKIDIAGQAAAPIDLGRVEIADRWVPAVNFSFGLQAGWSARDRFSETPSGAQRFDPRGGFQFLTGDLPHLPEDEAQGFGAEWQRQHGLHRPFLVNVMPDGPVTARARLGRLVRHRTIAPLVRTSPLRWSLAFDFREVT